MPHQLLKVCWKSFLDSVFQVRSLTDQGTVFIGKLTGTPDLLGKLEDVWEGPYEIQRKLGDVTYELAIPSRRSGKRRVHVNMLKEWKQGVTSVSRTVVANEKVENVNHLSGNVMEMKLSEEISNRAMAIKTTCSKIINICSCVH